MLGVTKQLLIQKGAFRMESSYSTGILIINLIIILILLGIGIYGFVLFVKLAKRGIKALDIYINEKTNNKF